jgi:hypothetical protein
LDRFHRFSVNRPAKFKICRNLKKIKKTRINFKIFGQNRIQKLKVNRSGKFEEAKIEGKTRKIENRLVPFKAPTLGCYPQLPEPILPPFSPCAHDAGSG